MMSSGTPQTRVANEKVNVKNEQETNGNGSAQNRLEKLRRKLQDEREAVRNRNSSQKATLSSISKTSLAKLKKKDRIFLDKISDEKKKKIQETVLPTIKENSSSTTMLTKPKHVNPAAKINVAQIVKKNPSSNSVQNRLNKLPKAEIPIPLDRCKLPKIPKKPDHVMPHMKEEQKNLTTVPSAAIKKRPQEPRRKQIPNLLASTSTKKVVNDVLKKEPPDLKKNLFKRKTERSPSEASSSKKSENKYSNDPYPVASTSVEKTTELPQTGFKHFLSKTCRGVVDALKDTFTSGAEKLSSYNFSRPNVTKQLQDVRSLVESAEVMDYEISCPTFENEQGPLVHTDLFLVIDTNVIIKELWFLQSLKNKRVKGMTPKLIVPWQVLKELDYLKEDKKKNGANSWVRGIHRQAQRGIRYILNELIQGDGYISGQPQQIASRNVDGFVIEIPDDHLIKCCLQLKWSGHNVLLLTNDKNLVIKAVVSEVPSMNCDEFAGICREQSEEQHITCFETAPTGELASDHAACSIHCAAILLKNFLTAVLKKLWMYKFNSLWMLQSPGVEPWPLTVLLERAFEVWNEISCGASLDVSEIILFLRRFVNKMTYEQIQSSDLDDFGRACYKLASSLPTTFGVEGVTFDRSLAFLKTPSGSGATSNTTFIGSCVSLTVHHFQLFEKKVVQYCYFTAQNVDLPFSYPKIPPSLPDGSVSLNDISTHFNTVKDIGTALIRLSPTPDEHITCQNQDVQNLYRALVRYLGPLSDPKFVVEDVVDFCKDNVMRSSFHSALQDLQIISTHLERSSRL